MIRSIQYVALAFSEVSHHNPFFSWTSEGFKLAGLAILQVGLFACAFVQIAQHAQVAQIHEEVGYFDVTVYSCTVTPALIMPLRSIAKQG